MKAVNRPLRTAVIGVTGYGHWHLKSLRVLVEEGLAEICAATIINQDEIPDICEELRSQGCRIYSDYRTMLEAESGRIDLCCIPTGIHWHRPMTVEALRAGMHVLVEKPVAATVEDSEAMLQARNTSGKQVFVGFQNMYAADLWRTKELLVSGELGQLKSIRVQVMWPRSRSYYSRTDWAGKLNLRGIPIFDSPANNAMAHFIMMALFWGGPSRREVVNIESLEVELYRAQKIESFDTLSARAKTHDGPELLFNMSHSSECLCPAKIVVEGERGRLHWSETGGTQIENSDEDGDLKHFAPYPDTRFVMFREICKALEGRSDTVCDLDIATAHTRFIHQLHHNTEILDLPEGLVKTRTTNKDQFVYMETLHERLQQAHQSHSLLSEVGLPQARLSAQA